METHTENTSHFPSRAHFATYITLLLTLLTGCSDAANSSSPVPATGRPKAACPQPAKVLLLADLTASGKTYGVELPDRGHLAELAEIIRTCTGELAFGTVESTPGSPLIRLRIDAPERNLTEPKREDFSNPFRYNDSLAAYRRNAAKIEAAEAQRQERIAQEQRNFLDHAEQVLAGGAVHQSTDLNGAIRRMNVYHQESTASWPREPKKYAILVTDGKQTVIGSHFEPLPQDVTVLVVYGSSDMGVLAKIEPTPLRFESIEAAIRHIKSEVR